MIFVKRTYANQLLAKAASTLSALALLNLKAIQLG